MQAALFNQTTAEEPIRAPGGDQAQYPAIEDMEPNAELHPGQIVSFKGRPMLIDEEHNLRAIDLGYFPVSSTGFYSGAAHEHMGGFWTPAELEKIYQEAAKREAGPLRDAEKLLKKANPKEHPVSILISLSMSLKVCIGYIWFTEPQTSRKALKMAAGLATAIDQMPDWHGEKYGCWTPEYFKERRDAYKEYKPIIIKALAGDLTPLAELEDVFISSTAKKFLGIEEPEEPRQEDPEEEPKPTKNRLDRDAEVYRLEDEIRGLRHWAYIKATQIFAKQNPGNNYNSSKLPAKLREACKQIVEQELDKRRGQIETLKLKISRLTGEEPREPEFYGFKAGDLVHVEGDKRAYKGKIIAFDAGHGPLLEMEDGTYSSWEHRKMQIIQGSQPLAIEADSKPAQTTPKTAQQSLF